MRILYALQGTGNGHVTRAREIVPILMKKHEVDVLISGTQSDIDLPFPVKYKCHGLGFTFGKKGGIDVFQTYKKSKMTVLFKEIQAIPVQQYDLVLNDFEPITAWACELRDRDCISLSHQAAVLNANAPQCKKKDIVGKAILKHYAPTTRQYGFHFNKYDKNIFTPVIRKEVRQQQVKDKGHYTVYLPSYCDERILKVLSEIKDVEWQVFSKHNKKAIIEKNVTIMPIDNDSFIKSMAKSKGVLCGAGFETPAEALFLGKKLMVIPMKRQFEQQCNAAALQEMGVPVIKSLKEKHLDKIRKWIEKDERVEVNYPDETEEILNRVIGEFKKMESTISLPSHKLHSYPKFRELSLKKIMTKLAG